jgi:hemoglobin/transferrin/lactoferrin receptor protein
MAHRLPTSSSARLPGSLNPLALAALAALMAAPAAHAQQSAEAAAAPASAASAPVAGREAILPRIVISATRIETAEDEVPATITSITDKDIERRQPRDLKSLLDDEPGISVRLQPARMSAVFASTGRGGNEGINVRGLEGNQVLLQTDGVRLPMAYDSGPFVAGRGDYIDLEAYKRVELLRGPSSTSYGSDGLAGAVSFVTKDPADLLTLGKPWQGAVKVGYASADKSWVAVPSFALRSGPFEAMLLASVRRGSELDNRGDRDTQDYLRTEPNPQDRRSDYVLGKAIYNISPEHQLKASVEHLERTLRTDPIYTVVGQPLVNANIIDAWAEEDVTRTMGKLEYRYNDPRNPWLQRAQAWVYAQDSENRQLGQERYRSPPAAWGRRTRDTRYGEDTRGGGVQLESNFGNAVAHRVLVGLDGSNARVTSRKDGAHYDAAGNPLTVGNFVANQSFPDTDYTLLGAFVQDEIAIGSFSVIPALRYDRFDLKPEVGNPLFTVGNTVPPTRLKGDEVSPRLGVVWKATPLAQPYAQYAHGFRAPTPWQVNGGVSNPTANPPYRSIGNPNLKPEISDSFELGLRGRTETLRYSIALFKSRYRDFIASNADVTATTTVPLDPGMALNTTTFQSINLQRAEIKGFELGAAYNFAPGWTVEARYAHAKGDELDATGNTPLQTIEPDKGVLKLQYERSNAWGGEFVLIGQKSQHRPYTSGLYIPKGYFTADVSAWWNITKQLQLAAAVNNIGDVKYALWSDVRGLTDTRIADAYTQPGRNISVSMRYQF